VTPPPDSSRTTVARPGGQAGGAKAGKSAKSAKAATTRAPRAAGAPTGARRRVVKPKPAPPPPPGKERGQARQPRVGRGVRRVRQLWREGGRPRPPGY
jgi:hypothetical protein